MCFWLEVLSYKIFGINNFSYKLPSFIFTLLGFFATFKLAKRLYSSKVAWLSVLILSTCQGFFLFNQDVRTDTILTASIIIAIWQIFEFLETKKIINFLIGFTFIAIAMLTKGPIGLMLPAIAISGQIIYRKRWKDFLRVEWLIGAIYVGILLVPFLVGLFNQFGAYGLKFYFWIQSFGRITGESQWHDSSDYLFFVHTFIWAFLPWAFLTIFALSITLSSLVKNSKKFRITELLTFSGFAISFIAFSVSKYKLPHYIFVLFPLAAILTALATFSLIRDYNFWTKTIKWIQTLTVVVLWILLYIIIGLVFPCENRDIWTVLIILNLLSLYYLIRGKSDWAKIIVAPALTIIAVNFMLNAHFYPCLLKYQAGKEMASAVLEINYNIYAFNVKIYSYDFYANKIVKTSTEDTIKNIIEQKRKVYIITNDEGLSYLSKAQSEISELKVYTDYPVTRLSLKFLNPSTRLQSLRKYYLLKLY
jgi:4-amino-4-deoxy-L-arabinose transferase-like glycosyltransferase